MQIIRLPANHTVAQVLKGAAEGAATNAVAFVFDQRFFDGKYANQPVGVISNGKGVLNDMGAVGG